MFKVDAASVDEYLRFEPARERDMRALDALIRTAAPTLSRWFVPGTAAGQPGMTMTMIGYGRYEYTVKSSPTPVSWPILGLALQKSYISLYNSANGDGPAFTRAYDGKLGRARISARGVITMTSLEDVDLQALAEMITAIETGLATGQLVAR
jgi:hypothetical protein